MNGKNAILAVLLLSSIIMSCIIFHEKAAQPIPRRNPPTTAGSLGSPAETAAPVTAKTVSAKENTAASLDSNQDPSKRTPAERTLGIKRALHFGYSKAIAGLELQSRDEEKLWSFLIAREEAGMIAHDVVAETRNSRPEDFGRMAAASRADVELEMQQAFDEQTYAKIKAMMDASMYIGVLNHSYDQAFDASGFPLTSKQFLSLSTILLEAYGPSGNPSTRPSASNVNPGTGFSKYDDAAIEQAAKVLSTQQISVFKNVLVGLNEKRLSQH